MPVFYINAQHRYRADSYTSIKQLNDYIASNQSLQEKLSSSSVNDRWAKIQQDYKDKIEGIENLAKPGSDGTYSTSYLCNRLRKACPEDTVWVIEAVTNTGFVFDALQCKLPGSWINCGSGGLGWSGGAVSHVKT